MTRERKIVQLQVRLARIAARHAPAALACSLGADDMVLLDVARRHAPAIEVFVLDTGRLHEETYRLLERIRARYGFQPRVLLPEPAALERFVGEHGVNPFYRSVELRRACCELRKVAPLARALAGKAAWITGQRRQQSPTRAGLAPQQFDSRHGILKFNPLADWTDGDVWAYLRRFDVPYNELHDRGYPSIGCSPCTRPVTAGEDPRAGRWWWEQPETKECGLHTGPRDAHAQGAPAHV